MDSMPQVTSVQARAAILASEVKAAVPVNITVLDAGARMKAFPRMDRAVLGSIDLATRTAVLFQTTSDAVWEYAKPGSPPMRSKSPTSAWPPFPAA